ncbi:MAG: hypothetical protein JST82_10420 [Bacteroidetes bacterium]|nr:hypothetical protein [Bacteroidota bacterium]
MRILVICLLFCFLSVAHAQETLVHDFVVGHDVITLNDKIAYFRVVDKRYNTASFGYITDYSTRKKQLITATSLQEAISKFANVHFINAANGTDTILFIVRNIYVEQQPTNMQVGTIYINADFFRGNNNQYRLLYSVDSFYEVTKGNVAKRLLLRLDELIGNYLLKSEQDSLLLQPVPTHSIDEAINQPDIEKSKLPVYQTQQYKRGVYMNAQEFFMQTPSVTDFKIVDAEEIYTGTKPGIYKVNKNGKLGERIKADAYYALFDGKWYLSYKKDAPEMRLINGDFYVNVDIETKYPVGATIATGILLGPIAGGIFAAVGGLATNGRYHMKLDYKTGGLIPVRLLQ